MRILNPRHYTSLCDVLPNGKGLLVMLRVYLDESKSDADDGVVAVAATVFKPLGYKRFVRPWNRMLRGGKLPHSMRLIFTRCREFQTEYTEEARAFDRDSKVIRHLLDENIEYILV